MTGNPQPDPITVEVIRSYYRSTANQMTNTLVRASFNPIIYEVLDFSVGVYSRDAELIAEGKGLPVFMGTLASAIRDVIRYVGEENIEDGDVLLCTYPYWTGAHSQDAVTIRPIFVAGSIFGYTAAKAHWMDIGAKDIYGTDTTDIWQEGLQLFGVKIVKRGRLDRELVEIIRANSRVPKSVIGDMTAQIAACELGARRVAELTKKYGAESVLLAIQRILDQGEEIARQAVRAMPDGTWTAESALDDDGISDVPVPIRITVTISGDQMIVDTAGSAAQTTGPMNCPLASTVSACRLAMKMIVAPHYPANEGFFRPLTVRAPEGTVLNPKAPAPVFLYGWATIRIGEALFAALAEAVPELSVASSGGDIGALLFSARNPDGSLCAGSWNDGCGQGASIDADGENALIAHTHGESRNMPIEIIEERFPFLTERYGFRADSGGPGKFRGGLGVERQLRLLNDIHLISCLEQTKVAGPGVHGGRRGTTNVLKLNPDTPAERRIGKISGCKMKAGERMRLELGGGAGWGDPFERSPEAVLADVTSGYLSLESAERDYGVVIRQEGLRYHIDAAATAALRGRRVAKTA